MERSTSLLNRLQNFFITEVPNDEKPTTNRHLPNSSAPLLLEYNLPSNDEDNQREDKRNELMEKQRRREHFLTMYNSEKGSTEADSRRRYRRWSAEESQHGTTFEAARSNTELSRRSSTTASTRSTLSVDAQHTVIEYRRVPRKQQVHSGRLMLK